MTKCRRCTECQDYEHHWFFAGYDFKCKHCTAHGSECGRCYGEGIEPGTDDDECIDCDGEGVILVQPAA